MLSFQDLFSKHAACYAQARPGYPAELFDYLAGLCVEHKLVWDVGTGSGQAAIGLAEHFEKVVATDASEGQLAHATAHPRVEYRVALAEEADLPAGSIDLVTIAQALHWFRFDTFYANVRRVVKPSGIIAAWTYHICRVEPKIDDVCRRLYRDITGPYWAADRKWVEERYETVPFPFEEVRPTPTFECRENWTLAQYVGYLSSWSATQKFKEHRGYDPLTEVADDLAAAWGDANIRRLVWWPIHLRVGQINKLSDAVKGNV